ncbi:DNA polymerase [Pectobacterium phage Arno162]|uniref:DNA polymerase n=1 Tax=Pectobacterium phage Arno162 TaxID=2500577 RepID=A0A678ZJR3_9CAUD|nr:DNA polymerase [Pectobacterium phage Arno162]
MIEEIDFSNLCVVGDSETNGLLEHFDKVHVIAFCDYKIPEEDEQKIWVFTDEPILGHKYTKYIKGGLREGVEFALKANRCCIHNFMQYDWFVFNHIAPDIWNMKTVPPWDNRLQDSLVQSRVQWYDRPCPRGYKGAHGLAAWGARVGVRKPEIDEWGVWNGEILTRVVEDIKINAKTKRALDNEYLKLKTCGADTGAAYLRAKQTSFWMAQQAINGWKADVPLMMKYVKELDEEINKLADEIEPNLPMTIKDKGSLSYEEFKGEWDKWVKDCGLSDVRQIRKVPPTKYRDRMVNGEIKPSPIRPLAKCTVNIWNIERVNCYTPTNKVTGEQHTESFIKMADARSVCKSLGKDWVPVKTVNEKKIYNTHVAKHYDFTTREYDGVIAAPYTPITFLPSKLTQSDVVKKYLYSCGWVPMEWNFKKDADKRPVKICKMIDTGSFIRKCDRYNEMVEQCGLSYVEHDGQFYIEYKWSIKKHPLGKFLEPSLLRTSPKLTEDSFDTIEGELGQGIARYNTLQHRRRTMENSKDEEKGWLNQIRFDGRLSAGATVHGTSTGRMTQWGIVNVPSGAAVFGSPMREVWTCEDGTQIVSVDMNSAQLVILCNFMGDDNFTYAVKHGKEELEFKKQEDGCYYCKHTDEYLNPEVDKYLRYDTASDLYVVYAGTDAHTLNSVYFSLNEEDDIITCRRTQDESLLHKISGGRKKSKNGIYCLLFGGGDERFAKTIKMRDKDEGARVKQVYFTRLPKIKALLDNLEDDFKVSKKALAEVFGQTSAIAKGGFVHVAGAHLWVKSPHKLLNYLLMGTEAQIQNEAVNLACRRMVEEGLMVQNGRKPAIGARLLCAYHDEQSYECPDEMTTKVKAITDWMYGQASENLKLLPNTLVTGAAKIGKNWLEVH